MTHSFLDDLLHAGFVILPSLLNDVEVSALNHAVDSHLHVEGAGARNVLDFGPVLSLATRSSVADAVARVLGARARAVRALLFEKTVTANWRVAYHQDLTIAVKGRGAAVGYGPWSLKDGVHHVQPPISILEGMVAARLHLDPCLSEHGPVRVLPGSHRFGRISENDIPQLRSKVQEVICTVPSGGLLLMRPLLLHASSPAISPNRRRVLHIEYASDPLVEGLAWRWEAPIAPAAV